jgi:hypothetical protein
MQTKQASPLENSSEIPYFRSEKGTSSLSNLSRRDVQLWIKELA